MGRWGNVAQGFNKSYIPGQQQIIQMMLYDRRQKEAEERQKRRDIYLQDKQRDLIDYRKDVDVEGYKQKRAAELKMKQDIAKIKGTDAMTEFQRKSLGLKREELEQRRFDKYINETYDNPLRDAFSRYKIATGKADEYGVLPEGQKKASIEALKEYRALQAEKKWEIDKAMGKPVGLRPGTKIYQSATMQGPFLTPQGFGDYHKTKAKADAEGAAQGVDFSSVPRESVTNSKEKALKFLRDNGAPETEANIKAVIEKMGY